MSNTSSMPEPKVLLDGLAYVESPRWHDGRLWFPHWGTGEIVAVDLDGICLDAEGAIWVQTAATFTHTRREDTPAGAVVRVREGGEVLQRIEHDRAIFATMLGGPDRTTLFLLAAEWRGIEQVNEAVAARTGQVLVS